MHSIEFSSFELLREKFRNALEISGKMWAPCGSILTLIQCIGNSKHMTCSEFLISEMPQCTKQSRYGIIFGFVSTLMKSSFRAQIVTQIHLFYFLRNLKTLFILSDNICMKEDSQGKLSVVKSSLG